MGVDAQHRQVVNGLRLAPPLHPSIRRARQRRRCAIGSFALDPAAPPHRRPSVEKSSHSCYLDAMTRTEAIGIITATLPALDDAQAAMLAEVAQGLAQPPVALALTDEDRAGIASAREDFEAGRSYSSSEARAMTAAFFAKLRAASPSA